MKASSQNGCSGGDKARIILRETFHIKDASKRTLHHAKAHYLFVFANTARCTNCRVKLRIKLIADIGHVVFNRYFFPLCLLPLRDSRSA